MRLALALYFIFACVSDPWIDGMSSGEDAHQNVETLISHSHEGTSELHSHGENSESQSHLDTNTSNENSVQFASNGHDGPCSEGCTDDCPQHWCHIGHCGFPVSLVNLNLPNEINDLITNFNEFSTSPHIRGLKRPPKV